MAADRERKWKLNMAKKYVRAVARSNLDLESRKNVRQKEAELAVRRKAAFIGKEVCIYNMHVSLHQAMWTNLLYGVTCNV